MIVNATLSMTIELFFKTFAITAREGIPFLDDVRIISVSRAPGTDQYRVALDAAEGYAYTNVPASRIITIRMKAGR
jgi:hypothetical protein